jgi:hypothetical protein
MAGKRCHMPLLHSLRWQCLSALSRDLISQLTAPQRQLSWQVPLFQDSLANK